MSSNPTLNRNGNPAASTVKAASVTSPIRGGLLPRISPEGETAAPQCRRAALMRLAAALGRAEARRLARLQRGAAVGTFLLLLAAAALLAAALEGATR